MKRERLIAIALCAALAAGVALASFYDDYDAGLKALHDGQFQLVVQKMTAAINARPKENSNERTYGNIFINYHPYYYRAVAYINLGKYELAIADLEKTSGPGAIDRGSIESLMQDAKKKLAEISTTGPVTKTEPPPPPPPPPLDKSRARAALDQAKARLQAAESRKATAAQSYQDALRQYTDANVKLSTARTNDDLNTVIATAENVTLLADSAQAPVVITTTTQAPPPPLPPVQTTTSKTTGVERIVLGDTTRRLHRALQSYFNGDFDEAARDFQALTNDMPKNGWIWAFLGASQYSQYAFEADETYKNSAISSFRKAKTYGKWKDGLPQKYFSRKIRKAFKENAG